MTDTLRFRACKVNKQQSSGGYKIDGNVPAVSGEVVWKVQAPGFTNAG